MIKQKEVVKTETEDGKELVLAVKYPSNKLLNAANRVYAKAWRKAVEVDGLPLRAVAEKLARKNGLWDDEKTEKLTRLSKDLMEAEKKLAKGGVTLWGLGVDASSAQKVAVEMVQDRNALFSLINEQNQFYSLTAEADAESARLSFLIVESTVYNETGEKYFKSVEDYEDRIDEKAPKATTEQAMKIIYPSNDTAFDELPENKFLKKYGMVDDQSRFVNKDGKLIDITGRLIDDRGRYVNDKNEVVDFNGSRIDESGNYIEDFTPFLDEDGKPIEE